MTLYTALRRRFSRDQARMHRNPDSPRRLAVESLEPRALLSAAPSLIASAAPQQTVADLPDAAQQAIFSAIGRDQSANHAVSAAAGVTLANPENSFTAQALSAALPIAQEAKLSASAGAPNDWSGYAVSISGDTLVVGAPHASVYGIVDGGAAYVFTESGSAWAQTAELTASYGRTGDEFGFSVAISGNTIVVGAPHAGVRRAIDEGEAYVFTEYGSTWFSTTETARLTASDGARGSQFGASVSISGNTVVVGAPDATVGGNVEQGAAYVFTEPGSGWAFNMTETAELTASDGAADDQFGFSVSTGGNALVVGAPHAAVSGNIQQGAAYVFTEPGPAWTSMIQSAKLTASDGAADDQFGVSVSIGGNALVVGAPDAAVGGNSAQGAVYVFTEPGSAWISTTQTAKVTASDGAADDQFGASVAISGNTVAVGAPDAAVGGNSDAGAAYVFTEPDSAWTNMTQSAKLTASDGAADDDFGTSVAISGNTIVAGSPYAMVGGNSDAGAIYVFTEHGSAWASMTETDKLATSPGESYDDFGGAVAISGDMLVVGSPYATVGGNFAQGLVYVFTGSGAAWTQVAQLTASDGAAYDDFGFSVAIGGNTVVVGAPDATVGGNSEQGAAYVFTEPASGWSDMTQTAKLTASDGGAENEFGCAVSISGNTAVVGSPSPYAPVGSKVDRGAAYVFTGPAWTQTAELAASGGAADETFGNSLSISGKTLVVGAPLATIGGGYEQGVAYVFTQSGSTWSQSARLTAPGGGAYDFFGFSVSISGNTLVAGAPNVTLGGRLWQGAAYVFTGSGSRWTEAAGLTASDGKAHNEFGSTVSISGNTVLVGVPNASVGGDYEQGAVYVFTKPGAAWASRTQTAKLTASDGVTEYNFGASVSISGNTLVAGTPGATADGNSDQGAAYVFLAQVPAATPTVTGVSPTPGPTTGGISVTITGTGFSGTTRVDFGTIAAADVVINSATQITATSPAESAGTVNVRVTTPGGTSATSSADKFTYVAAPATTASNAPISADVNDLALLTVADQSSPSGATHRKMVENLMALLLMGSGDSIHDYWALA